MTKRFLTQDVSDLLFRTFFCSIFFILGFEHLFSDEIIQKLMPIWVPAKRAVSLFCGIIILSGASLILLGFQSKFGAKILAAFLIVVTFLVHAPDASGSSFPLGMDPNWAWLWTVFQRSNLVKNLCLFGVCCHLMHHKPGKYSLENYLLKHQ